MKAHEAFRYVASLAPVVGVVAKPEARPSGISAIVRVKGEEEWIEPCLFSIRELADEILVLDNGASPETQKALDRLRDPLRDLLRIERCPHLDLFEVSNLALEKARSRWVVRWDADFVAHTSGAGDIRNLRRYLLELDPRRYYLLYLSAAEVAGDLFHQFPDRRLRSDGQVHTASARARYVSVHRRLTRSEAASPDWVLRSGSTLRVTKESLWVPKFYRILRSEQVTYFHIFVKSARQTLMRHFWLEWLGQRDFHAFPTLESYALAQIRQRWGLNDLQEAGHYFMTNYCQGLVPFDPERCGPYPEVLRPFLATPRYLVDYRDSRIVGRTEGL
jgi:glycosyltransferase involved in cell wall biosynthesis